MATVMTESAIRGRLDPISLLELITGLVCYQRSGLLVIQSRSQAVEITVDRGSVQSVSLDDSALLIGQVLIQLGAITEEQIEQALALQSIATDPERIGEVLVDVGYITEIDISRAIATQIASSLEIMFNDLDRRFRFESRTPGNRISIAPDITHEPLVLMALYLAEHWFEQNAGTEGLAAGLLVDEETIERFSPEQQEVLGRLDSIHHKVSNDRIGQHSADFRVEHSISRVIEHVMQRVTPADILSAGLRARSLPGVPAYQVHLIDRTIDIWGLTDLTRNARNLLLNLLNGEDRLSVLLSNLKPLTSNPDRAIRELSSAGLIRLEIDHRAESRKPGTKRDRTVTLKFLP